jgi:carbonic anhydrase/acetyltransferase-like protein (isoleucine patch superfamily)
MALAGLAVGERAAVGERDRVVGGVEVGDRVLVATRAALGVAGVKGAGALIGGQRLEQVGEAARPMIGPLPLTVAGHTGSGL